MVKTKAVVVSQHVRNIEGLTDKQNEIVEKVLNQRSGRAEGASSTDEESISAEDEVIAPKPKTNERSRIPDAKALEIVQKPTRRPRRRRSKRRRLRNRKNSNSQEVKW